MAIGMIFDAKGVTRRKYEQVRDEVGLTNGMPHGMLYHVAGPTEGGWTVIEIWESEADARTFFEAKLAAALKRAEISVQPKTFQVDALFEPRADGPVSAPRHG